MSNYINEALRFYYNSEITEKAGTIQELAKTIQTLIQTRDFLLNEKRISPFSPAEETNEEEKHINEMLANSIESICGL